MRWLFPGLIFLQVPYFLTIFTFQFQFACSKYQLRFWSLECFQFQGSLVLSNSGTLVLNTRFCPTQQTFESTPETDIRTNVHPLGRASFQKTTAARRRNGINSAFNQKRNDIYYQSLRCYSAVPTSPTDKLLVRVATGDARG